MARFPTRTVVLMALALVAFGWMWRETHRRPDSRMSPADPVRARVVVPPDVRLGPDKAPGGGQ